MQHPLREVIPVVAASDYEIEFCLTPDTITLQGFPESVWYLNGCYVRQHLLHRQSWVYMSGNGLILYSTVTGHAGICNNDAGWQDVADGVGDRYFVRTDVWNSLRYWSAPVTQTASAVGVVPASEPRGEVWRFAPGGATEELPVHPEAIGRASHIVAGLRDTAKGLKGPGSKSRFYEAVHEWFPVWSTSRGQRFQIRKGNNSDAKVAFEVLAECSYVPKCKQLMHSEKLVLQSEDNVLDLGANVGVYMMYAFVVVGVRSIYCVEPGRQSIEMLKRNVAWAAFAGCECTVHAVAIAAEAGENVFNDHTVTEAGSSRARLQRLERYKKRSILCNVETYPVPCVTLEQLLCDQFTFVKMDVEGADLEVLSTVHAWKNVRRLQIELSVDLLRDKFPDGGGFDVFVEICEALREGGFQLGLADTLDIFDPEFFKHHHYRKGYDNNLWFWRPVPPEAPVEDPAQQLTYFHHPRQAFAMIQSTRRAKGAQRKRLRIV